jgi:hypothetical protein
MESMNQQLLRKKLKQEEDLRAHEAAKQKQMERFEKQVQQRRGSTGQDSGSMNFNQIIQAGDLDTLNQVTPPQPELTRKIQPVAYEEPRPTPPITISPP